MHLMARAHHARSFVERMVHGLAGSAPPSLVEGLSRIGQGVDGWFTLPHAGNDTATSVDDWFTRHYAGSDWATSGLQGTLPWKALPLSSVWAPIIGVAAYLGGESCHRRVACCVWPCA